MPSSRVLRPSGMELYVDRAVCGLCDGVCVGRAGQRSLGYSLRNPKSTSSGDPSDPVLFPHWAHLPTFSEDCSEVTRQSREGWNNVAFLSCGGISRFCPVFVS